MSLKHFKGFYFVRQAIDMVNDLFLWLTQVEISFRNILSLA